MGTVAINVNGKYYSFYAKDGHVWYDNGQIIVQNENDFFEQYSDKDKFVIINLDTTSEQEKNIEDYYNDLRNNTPKYSIIDQVFGEQCTTIARKALLAGDVFTNDELNLTPSFHLKEVPEGLIEQLGRLYYDDNDSISSIALRDKAGNGKSLDIGKRPERDKSDIL